MSALISRKNAAMILPRHILDPRPTMVVEINGYEYVLVECNRNDGTDPCALGHKGFVLREVRRIKKKKNEL
jgi:hypothetical protein